MAKIPTPRSYSAVLADMVDAFLAKFGLKQMRVGSPVLSILEAAAMSDVRSSQDIFDLLASTNLDRATGTALDRIAADENMARLSMSPSSGTVTISDSRMSQISTRIYQGDAAPIVGSSFILVADASQFPNSGAAASKRKIYIGRGTTNVEGPLTYTSTTDLGTHWRIELDTGSYTTKFHNLGESVILAQNGNRTIPAGSIVQTAASGSATPTQFGTLYSAVIPDGEKSVEGVIVVARQAGEVGNVPQNTINSFVSNPFPGAEVLNPLPLSNGREAENDTDLRERIKNARQSRSRGTALSVKNAVIGVINQQENKRVTSASIVKRTGGTTTLYIDDGTGYEERSEGLAIESLNDFAQGGEQFFQLSLRPVAKASVQTTNTAPFSLTEGAKLSVMVGGVLYEHTFLSSDFRSIGNASSYEVVSSINANSSLQFSARTSNGGSNVVIFAKDDTNEDIQVASPSEGIDANAFLSFPKGRADTLRLYKNDQLLSKDGRIAQIRSKPFATWQAMSGPQTLMLAVDGTPAREYEFTDQDFIDASTGFNQLAKNTAQAWASVLNAKIPGITATVNAGAIVLTSNAGRTSKAKLEILSGSLIQKGAFAVSSSFGRDNDYTVDRNTAQIRLESPLKAGDRLAAGSVNTRAFIQSSEIKSVTLPSQAIMFFAVDGEATAVKTGITNSTAFDITGTAPEFTFTADASVFANANAGDWLVIWDSATDFAPFNGQWKIVSKTNTSVTVKCPGVTALGTTDIRLSSSGLAVVRFDGVLQKVVVPAASNYTAPSVTKIIAEQLTGASCNVYRTKYVRIRTNTFDQHGSVSLVAANSSANLIGFYASAASNNDSQLGSVQSENGVMGTPTFISHSATQNSNANSIYAASVPVNHTVVGLGKTSNNFGFVSSIKSASASELTLRTQASSKWLTSDRFYSASPLAIGSQDDLVIVADSDVQTKRFSIGLWREIEPAGTSYSATNEFQDTANSGQTLVKVFGKSYDFNDHAIYMQARAAVAHSGEPDATADILYRYKRFGPEGNQARVRYVYPSLSNQPLSVSVDDLPSDSSSKTNIEIRLPSGASKRPTTLTNGTVLGYDYRNSGTGLPTAAVLLGFEVQSVQRTSNVVTVTVKLPTGGVHDISGHGLSTGNNVYFRSTYSGVTVGIKNITKIDDTKFSFVEAGADFAAQSNPGHILLDQNGVASFSGVQAGDLVSFAASSTAPEHLRGVTMRISDASDLHIAGYVDVGSPQSADTEPGKPTWTQAFDITKFDFFPLNNASCAASAIVSSINQLGDSCPITAESLKDTGADAVSLSTIDLKGARNSWYELSDGINWIETTTMPLTDSDNYSFTLKQAVSVTDGWSKEKFRIAPITLDGLRSWLSVPALSGLFSTCAVEKSSFGHKLQISSLTPGSTGSVQVQGGTANALRSSVIGSASSPKGTYIVADIRSSDAAAMQAGQWVSISNAKSMNKGGVLGTQNKIQSITADGTITLTSDGPALKESDSQTATVSFEKQGRFLAITGATSSLAAEGNWITIASSSASAANQGAFRIVRASGQTVWIENEGAVEGSASCDLVYTTASSLMPGDVVSFNTSDFGPTNKGKWTVRTVSDRSFTVTLATGQAMGPFTGPTQLTKSLLTVIEAAPARFIKKIHSIVPSPRGAGMTSIKFDTSAGYEQIAAGAGSVVSVLDKLGFSNTTSYGVDGYAYNVGLISEASRVIYGDEADPITYPGYVAAGSVVNVSGPIIKRATVSLSIRARFGVSTSDVSDRVKAAVATAINKVAIGQGIAISDVVKAASRVSGVLAVTVLEPTYGAGNDTIPVQPYEKLLVLDVDQDITVTFVGE